MLRASGNTSNSSENPIDIAVITDGDAAERSGVLHAKELVAFSEAIVSQDPGAIEEARKRVEAVLGGAAMVDAAAVAANFQRMVRIADGCGIPLDAPLQALGAEARESLSLDRFTASANTPPAGLGLRLASPLIRGLQPWIGKIVPRLPKRKRG